MGSFVDYSDLRERIYLPSTQKLDPTTKEPTAPEAEWEWVVLNLSPQLAGDIEVIDSDQTAGESALRRVMGRIVEWSYTMTDGSRYPVSYENIKKLNFDDYMVLKNKLDGVEEPPALTEAEKKTSEPTSTQSIPVTSLE